MDHLWLDQDLQTRPDDIAYYEPGALIYNTHEKEAWMQQVQPLLQLPLVANAHHDQNVRVVLQEFLFFGFLDEFCRLMGTPFHRTDFIALKGDNFVLTTAKLHLLCEAAFRTRVSALVGDQDPILVEMFLGGLTLPQQVVMMNSIQRPSEDYELQKTIEGLLALWAQSLTYHIRRWSKVYPDPLPLLSYCIMLESLTRIFDFEFGLLGHSTRDVELTDNGSFDHLWLQRCRSTGICPQRIEGLMLHGLPMSQLYMATSIIAHPASNHENCGFGRFCEASPPDTELPTHTHKCTDGCKIVVLTPEDRRVLEERIKDDGYGVLKFARDSLDNADFYVQSFNDDTQYVAFSHVW